MSATTLTSPSRPITVTQSELRAILEDAIKRATPLSFIALTTPEQKQNPALGGVKVKKLVRVNAFGGCRYAAAAERKGLTVSDERAWGNRSEAALVTKPSKSAPGGIAYYLPVQRNSVSRPLYLIPGPSGRLVAVANDKVRDYLRPERPSAVAEYKDYALSNILALNINRRRYRVRQEAVL